MNQNQIDRFDKEIEYGVPTRQAHRFLNQLYYQVLTNVDRSLISDIKEHALAAVQMTFLDFKFLLEHKCQKVIQKD